MDKVRFTDESLLAKAVDLTGLVDYQSNAVVSRTIIDRKTGTVTLFAFDKAVVTISEEDISLKAGEVTVMPAHRPHALKAVDRFKMMLVMIRDA
jgi:ethanolamine utilization microcompartment shell protein EutS